MMIATSYTEARDLVEGLGRTASSTIKVVTVSESLGHLCAKDVFSPVSTPRFDTSAMDGYAVRSKETKSASEQCPVWLTIRGLIAAGQEPLSCDEETAPLSCIEIMTGARFPQGGFDAVIPVERVACDGDRIRVVNIVRQDQHRRFAGSDYTQGDCIVTERTLLKSQHIMALASVGITSISILHIRARVWSTGLEIINGMMNDANGPFLTAALKEGGVDAEFAGVLPDCPQALVDAIGRSSEYDLMLTTGAVSAGKFDFIKETLDMMKAKIHFHHVAIRPGHPVLCASVGKMMFFGLPGNPIAAAACMRFLVVPFLRGRAPDSFPAHHDGASNQGLDAFRHAKVVDGRVHVNTDQSPAKIKSFSRSNCWVHVRPGENADQHSDCHLL